MKNLAFYLLMAGLVWAPFTNTKATIALVTAADFQRIPQQIKPDSVTAPLDSNFIKFRSATSLRAFRYTDPKVIEREKLRRKIAREEYQQKRGKSKVQTP